MSKQHSAVAPDSMKRQALKALKKRIGDDALATIQDVESVDAIEKALSATEDTLSFSVSKYSCMTQASMLVHLPKTSDPISIQVGIGGEVPRWKKRSNVNFAAYAGGYPTPTHAIFAAYRLYEAANEWNRVLQGRVTFRWVGKLEDAAFVLAYGGNGGSTLAQAFFPNSNDLNTLVVYSKGFEPGIINNMSNIFLHELGHVLGLRHEFAAQEGGNVPFGTPNPLSVMSYNFPPQIQSSDESDTKDFYDFPGGSIGPYPVHDYIPDN
jgi:hypothetical protein